MQYLLRDDDAAADVIQNSFIKAFINLRGFNVKKKFSSWIYRIVHNEAINEIKKHKREISLDSNEWLKDIGSDDKTAEEDIDKERAKTLLKENLQKIPLKYSEPLELYYIEERSYEEISDILKMPTGTVGTRISRGKKALKKYYEKD
jgi:RNA polymerase sigma-70 factor (ECF subfamily)